MFLLSLAGAVALVAEPQPVPSDDPDLRCFAAVSLAIGVVTDQGQENSLVAMAMASAMMYYMGRIDVRFPGIDMRRELIRMVQKPGYQQTIAADMRRCGKEVEERGIALKQLGEELEAAAPFLDSKPG